MSQSKFEPGISPKKFYRLNQLSVSLQELSDWDICKTCKWQYETTSFHLFMERSKTLRRLEPTDQRVRSNYRAHCAPLTATIFCFSTPLCPADAACCCKFPSFLWSLLVIATVSCLSVCLCLTTKKNCTRTAQETTGIHCCMYQFCRVSNKYFCFVVTNLTWRCNVTIF
jgi:hypothetical protein